MTGVIAGLLISAGVVVAIAAMAWREHVEDTADQQSAEILASLGVHPEPHPAAYRQVHADRMDLELWDLIDTYNHDSTGEDPL